jgi:uncharacterized membrane protein
VSDDDRTEPPLATWRVEGFSDAVFAIAATLLVLSLSVPVGTTDDTLGSALRHHALPRVVSYAISFAVIGRFWLVHHRLFSHIEKVDTMFVVVNLTLLGFVAVIPFPTALLGEFNGPLAVTLYAATVAAAGTASTVLWLVAIHHHLLRPGTSARVQRLSTLRSASAPVVFLASIPIAFLIGPTACELSWLVLIPARHVILRLVPSEPAAEPGTDGSADG